MPSQQKTPQKYGKLPTKQVVSKPWETLCVDLIGPYTLKGKDGTEIDFMCVRMIDPATSWFKIVELPVTEFNSAIPTGKEDHKGTNTHNKPKEAYFDKSSAQVSSLVHMIWFSHYPRCEKIIYDMEVSSNSISKIYVNHTVLSISHPASRTPKQMQYWSRCTK